MAYAIVFFILATDQLSKYLAAKYLALYSSVVVIKGIFHLSLVHNRGAAFGILKNNVPLFIIISLVAVVLIYWHLKKAVRKRALSERIALLLIFAGACGNLIDRVRLGYVVDFLDFRVWPVFNLADSAITIGAVILGWRLLFVKER
jgi:signal peptidase II